MDDDYDRNVFVARVAGSVPAMSPGDIPHELRMPVRTMPTRDLDKWTRWSNHDQPLLQANQSMLAVF